MIHQLYSIPILQEKQFFLLDNATINELHKECLKDNNGNYFSDNFKILEKLLLKDLKSKIVDSITYYQEEICGISKQKFYLTDSWLSVTFEGGRHLLHDHPNSLVSGVYYIDIPENSTINFYNSINLFQNFKFSFEFSKETPFNKTDYSIPVENGDLIIFPSWLQHYVNNNTSKKSRLVLGFNCFVEGEFSNQFFPINLSIRKN